MREFLHDTGFITMLVVPDTDKSIYQGEERRYGSSNNNCHETRSIARCIFGLKEQCPVNWPIHNQPMLKKIKTEGTNKLNKETYLNSIQHKFQTS